MDAERFDRMATEMAGGASRRALVGGMLAGAAALIAGAGPGTAKRKRRRCKGNKTRCQDTCVNTDTDRRNCGKCGNACDNGEQCLNGRCYSADICPPDHQACPNFIRCSVEDSDCFCGTTTGGETICFQDEAFCEEPRPCVSTNDCDGGRVCVDTRFCCEDRDLPDVPRTCLLPCENRPQEIAAKAGKARASTGGPGEAQ